MSFTLTKLSEVTTDNSLDNIGNFIIEQNGKIKKINKEHVDLYYNTGGKITDYGYFGKSLNRYSEDIDDYYYAFFDLEGNEVDNVDVVKAFNKGSVRIVNSTMKNGRCENLGYHIKDGKLYVSRVCLGEIDSSFTDIWKLPMPEDIRTDIEY